MASSTNQLAYCEANFCNPGLLGLCSINGRIYDFNLFQDEYSTFRRVYEGPILKSRTPDASPKDTELGEARTAQVAGFFLLLSFR